MFQFHNNIRVATIEGQDLYPYDIVSFDHASMDLKMYYIVFYDERMFAFSLVPLNGPSFPLLPLDYLDTSIHPDIDWEYHGQPEGFVDLTLAGPHDTFIENLDHYLRIHYHFNQ